MKQWIDNGNAPTRDELKIKSIKLQRLVKLFESIVIESHSNAMAIKTAEFEHPEIDRFRIIVSEHLKQDVLNSTYCLILISNPTNELSIGKGAEQIII